jgi:hypothetical protein
MRKNRLILAVPVLALAALTACGGGKSSTTTTTTTTQSQTAASPGVSPAATAAGGSMMSAATQAPIPASLHCGAAAPVWVNTKRHTYHTASDPYYGKTKNGQYMCASAAVAAGYHAAGTRRHHGSMSGSMQAQPQPSPT